MLSTRVKYFLSNGKKYAGNFCRYDRFLSGFDAVCHNLGIENFNLMDKLIFTFDCVRSFNISLFDGRDVEILLAAEVLAPG